MYTRPNNNKTVMRWVVGPAVLFMVVVAYLAIHGSDQVNPPGQPVGLRPAGPDNPVPVKNPIDELLKPPAGVTPRDGVAAAILIDVSGSMGDRVKDAQGALKSKIDIAKKCLLSLVNQTDRFTKGHPDRGILLGIYEFSGLDGRDSCRRVIPLGKADPATAAAALARMSPNGNTPIGNAILRVKRDLDATGMKRQHILVITDGENNSGYSVPDVVSAMGRQSEENRASVYLIAFDVAEAKFAPVREAGAMVLAASNENELQTTADYILTGKILAEQPETPKK